jgi:hypothetical protein
MTKHDLPLQADDSLDHISLIKMLGLLEGEEVCLLFGAGAKSRGQAKGIVRHCGYNQTDGFAIGDGVRLVVSASDFAGAQMRTYDGTEHFSIRMRFGDAECVLGDPGLIESDEFDLFRRSAGGGSGPACRLSIRATARTRCDHSAMKEPPEVVARR